MAVYKMNDIMKTLDKLFKYNINTTEKLVNIKWQDLDSVGEFTPFEKSLIMDFKVAAKNKKIVEFLAGVEYERKEE